MKRVAHACLDTFVPHERNEYRPHLLRSAGMIVAVLVLCSATLGSIVYRVALTQSDYLASVLPGVLVDLANADRSSNALGSLTVNPLLVKAAQLKADDMAAKGYFAHVSPDGVEPWHWFKEAGYPFVYAGENLAINFDDSSAVDAAWMNSPTHRANILGSHYTEIGIATAQGVYQGKATTFVVEEFGSPALPPAEAADMPHAAATSTAVTSTVAPAPAPKEQNIVAVAETESPVVEGSPAVSGASSYVAVKDESATPLPSLAASSSEAPVPVAAASAPSDRLLSSPSLLLKAFYIAVGILLLITLISVSLIQHPGQKRHLLRLTILSILLIALYLVAGYFTFSPLAIR